MPKNRPNASACHCTALRKASRRLSQLYDNALAPSGLKTTQRAILAQIRRAGPLTISALADALVMDRGGLAHTLKPLERDGFLSVLPAPEDGRSRIVSLSAKGRRKLEESDPLWALAQHHFEDAFGAQRSAALLAALNSLIGDEFSDAFNPAHH